MNEQSHSIPHNKMLKIIEAQTEITKFGLDLGMVMAITTEKAMTLLDADGAVIELAEKGEMVYRAASGVLAPFLGLRLAQDSSLSGLCVEQEQVLYSKDVMNDDRVDKVACQKVGINSMLVVPLKYDESCVGVLKVASKTVDFFGRSDTYILSLMSEMVAAIIFHAIKFSTDELYYRATHDPLTGVGNRAKFYDELRQHVEVASNKSSAFSILLLDMDKLKTINDTLGHLAGDDVIKTFAERLTSAIGDKGIVARIGGDEFAVLLPHVSIEEQIEQCRNAILINLVQPLVWESRSISLDASVGHACFPLDGQSVNALMHCADSRMYENKRRKKTP